MTAQTRVTLSKGGTAERVETISALDVPDLWNIAFLLENESDREAVRKCWHLAHDLKRHIEDEPEPLKLANGCELLGLLTNSKGEQFVMAKTDGAQPFATWQRNEDGATFWGHYFNDERAALADLIERAA